MSDTPRTDEAKEWHDCLTKQCGYFVYIDFARQLERELAAERANIEELIAACSVCSEKLNHSSLCGINTARFIATACKDILTQAIVKAGEPTKPQ